MMPQAVSMVKAVSFDELNLTTKDYEILDRVEASARIVSTITSTSYTVKDPEGSFELFFVKDQTTGDYNLMNFDGVVRAGWLLSRDKGNINLNSPEDIAQRMAYYRIINLVKEQGGDGIIEPVISTNVEQTEAHRNRVTVTYLTTVSGKVVRLKTSK